MAENKVESEEGAAGVSAAQAAKAVKREVAELGKDGKPTGKTKAVAVGAEELLAWHAEGGVVTVVTKDGQKFTGAL